MLLSDENECLEYITESYSEHKRLAEKGWTFQQHFNFVPEDLEGMLLDLFSRYSIAHSNFVMDNYFEQEVFWLQRKMR